MEWITNVWGSIEPYVFMVLTFLGSTGVGTIIGSTILKKWVAKNSDKNLAETISTKVSESIVTKPVRVSLENANKKNFKSLEVKIENKLDTYLEYINLQNKLSIAQSKIMLKFKNVTEEEREELKTVLNNLEKIADQKITEIEKEEPIVVNIEPIKSDSLF